jgi:hypothetical protein
MARATTPEPQPITLLLSREEAEDLLGLIVGHIAGNGVYALTGIGAALANVGVKATRFVAHPRHFGHDDDPVIVIDRRAGE